MNLSVNGFTRGGDGYVLFNRWQQHNDHGNGSERNTTARQAAEALFARKPQQTVATTRDNASVEQAVRKPRLLKAAANVPAPHGEPGAPVSARSAMRAGVPGTHMARIRAYLKYGMTNDQVAAIYGVTVDEIQRIARISENGIGVQPGKRP
jgi:hypothetical protein